MAGDSTGKEGIPRMILRSRVTDESEISANTNFLEELWNRFGPPSLFFSFLLPYQGQLYLPETLMPPVRAYYYVVEFQKRSTIHIHKVLWIEDFETALDND